MKTPPTMQHPAGSASNERQMVAGRARRLVRDTLRRDPEDHWAVAFGRIAGYSFAVAAVTGILLLPFFEPLMDTLVYHGSYRELDGVPVSQAYRSVLAISFDVHGGLLVRQVHHWSADLFVAAICLRLLRTFFCGRFKGRAPSDWLIWVRAVARGRLHPPARPPARPPPGSRRGGRRYRPGADGGRRSRLWRAVAP